MTPIFMFGVSGISLATEVKILNGTVTPIHVLYVQTTPGKHTVQHQQQSAECELAYTGQYI